MILINDVELRRDDNVLSTWIPSHSLEKFCNLLDNSFDEGGLDCVLLSRGVIWLDLVPICERYNIEPENILPK